jgi:hypothetical protein
MKLLVCAAGLAALLIAPVRSQVANPAVEAAMEEIVVAGEYPGPGLWRVVKAAPDGEHVLWIFGTPRFVPEAIRWKSREVERVAAASQELIMPESFGIKVDGKVGVFTMIRYLPAALRARKNPDDGKLQDVLPADVYARWKVLKARFIGRDNGIESWRPFFVAEKLTDEAFKDLRAEMGIDPWRFIGPVASEHKLRVTGPQVEYKVPKEQLRDALKTFLKAPLADVECLDATMKVLQGLADHDATNARAMAWAKGNLAVLRGLPQLPDPDPPCTAALVESQAILDLHLFEGKDQLQELGLQKWLQAVEAALTHNRSTLALLPIEELLRPEGRLSTLRAKGYEVLDPT